MDIEPVVVFRLRYGFMGIKLLKNIFFGDLSLPQIKNTLFQKKV